jgi:hypothetical protein
MPYCCYQQGYQKGNFIASAQQNGKIKQKRVVLLVLVGFCYELPERK